MSLQRRIAAISFVFALGAVACGGGAGSGSIGVASGFNVVTYDDAQREPAPPYAGPSVTDEGPISASSLRGKVVVLNFWGSWCGPCRREQPTLEALWKRYQGRGVDFVGVNTRRDQKAAAIAFLDEFEVTYPSIFDPSSTIASAFRVRVMPATYVIDARGRTAAVIVGALRDASDLTTILDAETAG